MLIKLNHKYYYIRILYIIDKINISNYNFNKYKIKNIMQLINI